MAALNMDNVALSMLAMAETLRIQQPPKFKMAIKCARVRNSLSFEWSSVRSTHTCVWTTHLSFPLPTFPIPLKSEC